MSERDDDTDIDRAYRAAVDLVGDADEPQQLQRRRRAVLAAVHAAAATAQAPRNGPAEP